MPFSVLVLDLADAAGLILFAAGIFGLVFTYPRAAIWAAIAGMILLNGCAAYAYFSTQPVDSSLAAMSLRALN